MCRCVENGCKPEKHIEYCYCTASKAKDCCILLGCKRAIHDSGHIKQCQEYKKCLCMESGCLPNKHKLPCVCTQSCTCTVYHCDLKNDFCDRKPYQKCRYYRVELCDHCDHLRGRAIVLKTYNRQTRRHNCECRCECDYECDGYCKKCDTHSQQGWNLLDWQKFRRPKIFTEQPKFPPYYFEDRTTGEQIKICYECQTSQTIMKQWYRQCNVCFDTVCYKCCGSYEYRRTDSDCCGDGDLYWRFFPEPCEVGTGNHFVQDGS